MNGNIFPGRDTTRGAVHMHSANCLTGCTGSTALPTTEEHRSSALDGTARSAPRVLSKGISSQNRLYIGFSVCEGQSPKIRLAIRLAISIRGCLVFCRGGSRTARMYTRRHKEETALAESAVRRQTNAAVPADQFLARSVEDWGVLPRRSIQQCRVAYHPQSAGHKRLFLPVRRFAGKPAPCRTARFFLVLFLTRIRKRT